MKREIKATFKPDPDFNNKKKKKSDDFGIDEVSSKKKKKSTVENMTTLAQDE